MKDPAYNSAARSAGSAKHLSMMGSTAPRKNTTVRKPSVEQREPEIVTPPENPQNEPKRKSRWWIWLIIGVVVVAAAAAAFFLLSPKETSEPVEEEVLVYGLEKPVIFESEECSFVIDDIGEKGDYLELDVRCINNTGDILSFTWESTCINGSMFDPLWEVKVQGNSTMRSSITFPLSTLEEYNLLPADQIKFVLRVHNESRYETLTTESAEHILHYPGASEKTKYDGYRWIKGYDDYLFGKNVKTDENGRPYYEEKVEEGEEKKEVTKIYFDELYNRNGEPLYDFDSDSVSALSFYNDEFGRPYYFSESADTVYYDGYGFAFYDEAEDKYYFYDEEGKPAYYGNGGIPDRYKGSVPKELADAGKPESLEKAGGCFLVNKEFTIYPTGKDEDDLVRPERITDKSEVVYWNGEKGNFIVLGGEMDEFKGYIVHTFVENKSDNYIYFGWENVVVNGVVTDPSTITVLRPHSTAYRDIIVISPLEMEDNDIRSVAQIDFNVFAVGENLAVPLYPIEWKAE